FCVAHWSGVLSSFLFSSWRRHTRSKRDWSSDVCSSDLGITVEFIFSAPHVLSADIWVEDYENLLASYEGRETYEIPYVFSIKEIGGAVFSVDLNQVLAINTIIEEEKDSFFEIFYEDNDDYGGDY